MEAHARREMEGGRKSDLLKIMEHKERERFTSAVWATAVEREDELAVELINGAVQALGAGAASAINLLDIEAVLIGGGLGVRFGDEYVERIREAMTKHLFPGHKMPAMELVGLGDLGGALGAALLVQGV
jgi:glucokinase